MGSLLKKKYTRPVPQNAERFQDGDKEYAKWKARGGKAITAPVEIREDGTAYVITQSNKYIAKYRDGSGNSMYRV